MGKKPTKRRRVSENDTSKNSITIGSNAEGLSANDPLLLQNEYEVEAILGIRDLKPGYTPQFRVKWKGYGDADNTWEPLENLDNCQEIVKDFLKSMNERRDRTSYQGPSVGSRSRASSTSPSSLSSASSMSSNAESKMGSKKKIVVKTMQEIMTIPPAAPLSKELQEFEDIFKASRGAKISVENTIDNAACPPGFKYTDEFIYGHGVQKPDPSFSSRCECGPGECSIENKCPCMAEAEMENAFRCLPFERDGRVSVHADKVLYECHSECGCGPTCISRASQQDRKFAMKIKRFPVKGWGVVLDQDEPIPPRTFVARYTGEIITNQEAEVRGRVYDKEGATWLFDLDYNTEKEAKYSIDASTYGNETHFFNHSCDPNLSVHMLMSGQTAGDLDMMTLSFWSNRLIKRGDELTFDYNGKYVQPWLPHAPRNDDDFEESSYTDGMVTCRCGSAKCRKFVHL